MTREDRWIVSLDEIASIRWKCGRCQVAVSYPLDQSLLLPKACPSCGAEAVVPNVSPAHAVFPQFLDGLKAVLRLQHQHPDRGVLQLEFLNRPAVRE